MPPSKHHHHAHRSGRRFRGGRGPGVVYFDGGPSDVVTETVLVVPSDLDALLVPPTDDPEFKTPGAGDFLPTVVTADSAKAYLREVDTGYSVLNGDITRSQVPPDFKTSWALQLAGWSTFYAGAMASVGFFDAKAVMGQTDRYATELSNWRKTFQTLGGTTTGPTPVAPGQGIPGDSSDTFKLVTAIGAIAAIVVFGPTLMRHFS